jgi:hypothetical protein
MNKIKLTLLALLMSIVSLAQESFNLNDRIEAEDKGQWYKATIVRGKGGQHFKDGKYFIHWDGYAASYDVWIEPAKIRKPVPKTTTSSNNNTSNNTASINVTSSNSNATASDASPDPNKYLFGDAMKKFKEDMKPFNEAVAKFAIYINPKPYGLGGTTYPSSKDIGVWLKKINELEVFLKANYPTNCNDYFKPGERTDKDYVDLPSVYRLVCENKINIAQTVMEYESIDASWNKRWIEQYKTMVTSVKELNHMYNDYLKYLAFPDSYKKEKEKHKEKYEPLYKNAGMTYDEKRIFAIPDSMLLVNKKFVDENIDKCPLSAWKQDGYFPYADATPNKMAVDLLKKKEPQAKVVAVYFDAKELYKTYDESYYPPKLTGKVRKGMIAYTLPYTNYVYMSVFDLVQDYEGGAFSATHFQSGDELMYFNGFSSNK